MSEDIVNIRLSRDSNEIADRLVSTGNFVNVITVAKFALAYTLKNHIKEINPATYVVPDSLGSNYNVGSFEGDGLATLIKALYPETTTPYLYARALIVFGLIKIGERIEQDGMQSISSFL